MFDVEYPDYCTAVLCVCYEYQGALQRATSCPRIQVNNGVWSPDVESYSVRVLYMYSRGIKVMTPMSYLYEPAFEYV